MKDKILKNAHKYPAKESKGTSAKYKRIYFTMLGEKQLAT
jgi:hypothetical protein